MTIIPNPTRSKKKWNVRYGKQNHHERKNNITEESFMKEWQWISGSWAHRQAFYLRSARVNARSTQPLKSALSQFYHELFKVTDYTSNWMWNNSDSKKYRNQNCFNECIHCESFSTMNNSHLKNWFQKTFLFRCFFTSLH